MKKTSTPVTLLTLAVTFAASRAFASDLKGTPAASTLTLSPQGPAASLAKLPDLKVDLKKATYPGQATAHEYTVSNIGDAASPKTKLRIGCEVLYTDSPANACDLGGVSPGFLDVPALQPGKSVSLTVNPAAHFAQPALPVHAPPYWRFRFTADVDPENKIPEKTKANNTFVHVSESFSGAPPK